VRDSGDEGDAAYCDGDAGYDIGEIVADDFLDSEPPGIHGGILTRFAYGLSRLAWAGGLGARCARRT
jgi:hypothetical protein